MQEPYHCDVRRGPDGRIEEKTETVAGRAAVWEYAYDKAGRLTGAKLGGRTICEIGYDREGRRSRDYFPHLDTQYRDFTYSLMDNRLQRAGNNGYTHDKNGFRSIWNHGVQYTLYEYGPDYRLLKAEKRKTGEVFEFTHDDQDRRSVKSRNGQPVEAYRWLDLLRLGGFHDGESGYRFAYRDGERTPYAMQRESGETAYLFYDQVGSLRVVADSDDNVIKEVLYDPFGGIIKDTNPALRIPIGFAGGLHDRDLGFVRFGWRDYDTFTSRWTAPDPLGDKGGDPDWYGYCLDDPVNGVDPLGLRLRVGSRKAKGVVGWLGGNHAYLYSSTEDEAAGMGASSGKPSSTNEEPYKDPTNIVENPNGVSERDVLDHMKDTMNDGIWFPGLNDCHEAIDDTCKEFGLKNPGAPGGRVGKIPHKEEATGWWGR